MVFDSKKDKFDTEMDTETSERRTRQSSGFVQETVLELVENDQGQIVLRDAADTDEPLVTIDFSSKVKDILGSDAQFIGHKMIHAAIQEVMQRQVSLWHANVFDEEPEHFS
ncbi:hypothetical protein [Psychrobacter lutiphocae]|uniref:hypothetical protein n=1 Tax=Psychrobacter lutiphocae TaxID=540500 RepID=UPI000364D522|nr:hypothetical protein [Psychrobacter lutiphocae]